MQIFKSSIIAIDLPQEALYDEDFARHSLADFVEDVYGGYLYFTNSSISPKQNYYDMLSNPDYTELDEIIQKQLWKAVRNYLPLIPDSVGTIAIVRVDNLRYLLKMGLKNHA